VRHLGFDFDGTRVLIGSSAAVAWQRVEGGPRELDVVAAGLGESPEGPPRALLRITDERQVNDVLARGRAGVLLLEAMGGEDPEDEGGVLEPSLRSQLFPLMHATRPFTPPLWEGGRHVVSFGELRLPEGSWRSNNISPWNDPKRIEVGEYYLGRLKKMRDLKTYEEGDLSRAGLHLPTDSWFRVEALPKRYAEFVMPDVTVWTLDRPSICEGTATSTTPVEP